MITETTSKPKVDFTKINKNTVFSETQFYTFNGVTEDGKLSLKNDFGQDITVNKKYVENCMVLSDQFSEEKTINKTQIAELFITNPFTVLTVNFNKQIKIEDVLSEIMDTHNNTAPKDVEKSFKSSLKKALHGEERVMSGRHFGKMNELGRVEFVDMNIERDESKTYDNRLRQVDPRSINWMILKGVKYIVK